MCLYTDATITFLLLKICNLIIGFCHCSCFSYLCVLFAAATILPVVQKQHQLLVTLLLCNAVAMEVHNLLHFFMIYHTILHCHQYICANILPLFQVSNYDSDHILVNMLRYGLVQTNESTERTSVHHFSI